MAKDFKWYDKVTNEPFPTSIMGSMHEPLFNPRDGHGARSTRDVMILMQWQAARRGDDDALRSLVKLIVDEDLAKLRGHYKTTYVQKRWGEVEIRSLAPVMALLGMISVETVSVPPERDGYTTTSRRQKISFEAWFEDFAFDRKGVDPKAIEGTRDWLARGGIQRPYRGECWT